MDRKFGDNVSDLSPKEISFADKFNVDGFCNPRHFYQGGEAGAMNGQGFDDDSMRQLTLDIQERGIMTPLICRWVTPDGKPCTANTEGVILQLVDGERRLRVALSLNLATVPCFVYENMSDDDAWKVAWRSNDTPKAIGENATAALVKHWRARGYTDQQILTITNRTSQWLRQMDTLGNLDNESFDAYAKGLLSLRVALKLALINDPAIRHELLTETLADAERDHEEILGRHRKAIEKAQEKIETVQAEKEIAGLMGQEIGEDEIKNAENTLKEAEKAFAEEQANPAQAKAKNLTRASKQVGARQVASSLTKAKMGKLLKQFDKWIENEGQDGGEFVGYLSHLHLGRNILMACLNGDDNMKKVFADYYEFVEAEGIEDNYDEEEATADYEEEEEEEEEVDPEEVIDEEEVYDELRKYGVGEEN